MRRLLLSANLLIRFYRTEGKTAGPPWKAMKSVQTRATLHPSGFTWQEQHGVEQVLPQIHIRFIASARAKAVAVQSVFVADRKSFIM